MSKRYTYHPDMPEHCPLPESEPVDIIYRAIENFPPVGDDFVSDVEAKKAWTFKKKPCKYWGCSVWKTREGVEHGRKIYDHFKQQWIVRAKLDPLSGQVCDTPSKAQPLHSTFWKVHKLDVSGNFKLAYAPLPVDPNDPLGPVGS
jgi:hypothetical protein